MRKMSFVETSQNSVQMAKEAQRHRNLLFSTFIIEPEEGSIFSNLNIQL